MNKKFKENKDFSFVGIGFGNLSGSYSTPLQMDTFVSKNKMGWRHTYMFDDRVKSGLGSVFGLKGIPYSLLVGKDGNIIAVDPRGDSLLDLIETALEKDAPDPSDPGSER